MWKDILIVAGQIVVDRTILAVGYDCGSRFFGVMLVLIDQICQAMGFV